MKKIIVFAAALAMACATAFSQNYTRSGKEFTVATAQKTKADSVLTDYTWRIKDKVYPVYLSPGGAAFIVRTSSKTGKQYRSYLPKEVAAVIVKETNFKPKSK